VNRSKKQKLTMRFTYTGTRSAKVQKIKKVRGYRPPKRGVVGGLPIKRSANGEKLTICEKWGVISAEKQPRNC